MSKFTARIIGLGCTLLLEVACATAGGLWRMRSN